MGFKTLINKFTAGEIDPKFLGQVDYDGYRKGARKLRNVFCTPQGSAQRRFGTLYERTIMQGAVPLVDPNLCKLIAFEYQSEEKYWLVLYDNLAAGVSVDIYLDATFQQTIAALGTYTPAQIQDIRWVEDVNKLIFLHESHQPLLLQRIAANNWTQTAAVLSLYPVDDFSTQDNPVNNYTNNGTTLTPNAAAATTVTASTAIFTSNHAGIAPNAGGIIIGNSGIFRIVSINAGGTIATGYVIEDFVDTSAIKGAESFVGERAWGDGSVIGGAPAGIARGYPRHGCFFQGRLVLGGSIAAPGTAYASEVKDYFSFDNSIVDPASGWGVEVGESGADKIQDLVASKSLVALTTKGSEASTILADTPTTALNVFMNAQGKEPSRNMDSVILNNQIIYADGSGNTIWSMIYDVPDSGYTVFNASIISAHLIRNPKWADVFDPPEVDGRYYLLVNADGTLGMYNTILEENIKSWTMAETIGGFLDIACAGNEAKVLVRRQVNTGVLINGLPSAVYSVDSTFNVFRNIKSEVEVGTPKTIMSRYGDYLLIGNEIPFTTLQLSFSTPASLTVIPTFQFLTNTGEWETFTPVIDGTAGFTAMGNIVWDHDDLTNWKSQAISETDTVSGDSPVYYWIRIKRNQPASITAPIVQLVKINVENRIHLEKLAFSRVNENMSTVGLYMDMQSQTTTDAAGLVTGLTAYAGQNVFVFVNDFPVNEFYVQSDGTMLLTYGNAHIPYASSNITLGLDYKPYIVPMPVVALLQNGYSVYDPKKIQSIYIDFYETLGLQVQGQSVPQNVPGQFITDRVPAPVSGFENIAAYAGWDPRVEIVITQSYPAPMTIRGISFEVEVS